MPRPIKQFENQLSAIRKAVIADLKTLIGKDTLEVYNNDIFISVQNTETLFSRFDSKGGEDEYGELVPWKEISTDLLILILKLLAKNIKKLK